MEHHEEASMNFARLPIRDYLDRQRPFSPLDAGMLEDDAREALFDVRQDLFARYQEKPQVVVGRRGAGKTAFLQSAYFTNPNDLIVSVDKGRVLGQICLLVSGVPQGGRYPEAVAELWDSLIYTIILQSAVSKYEGMRIARDYLAKIGASPSSSSDSIAWTLLDTVRETQKGSIGTIAELIRRLHNVSYRDAKLELFSELRRRNAKAIVLLDSLESEGYIFEDPDTLAALKGLLKWIGDTGTGRDPVQPRVSIPGEYYQEFLSLSSNPLKDFAKLSVLRWSVRQLIMLTGIRFRKFLELTEHPSYEQWAGLDVTQPKNALQMFRDFLPETLTIDTGTAEDSLLLVLRHTQLLPRQLFLILNTLFCAHEGADDISEAAVLTGVAEASQIVVSEVFGAYSHRYPEAFSFSRRLFPYLPEVFPYGDLQKHCRVAGRGKQDYYECLEMLIDIGAIGRVVDDSKRYVRGQFQYNFDGPLVVSSHDKLCVHPLFRAVFQSEVHHRPSRVWPIGL
jgi:hypothetical protein